MFAYLLLTGYSLHLCREINLDDELSTTRAKKEAEIDQELAAGPADIKNWGVALLAGVMEISLIQCLNTFLRYVAVAVHSPSQHSSRCQCWQVIDRLRVPRFLRRDCEFEFTMH
jgi:hypothetical protein